MLKRILIKALPVAIIVSVGAIFLPALPALADEPIEVVEKAPIDKQPTDPGVLKAIEVAGADKEYVELVKDYGLRSEDKSPYSRTYSYRKDDLHFFEVSQLPMVDAEGDKLRAGWFLIGDSYYTNAGDKSYNNLFWGKVTGRQVTLAVVNDQPTGARAGDQVIYDPVLFVGEKDIRAPPEPMLLEVDPSNENYSNNVLTWDYGVCTRQVRVIGGMYRETWIFSEHPGSEVKIVHNQKGNFPLQLGQYAIDSDTEVAPIEAFDRAEYPLRISASATYYPDAHEETSSVDGSVREWGVDKTWGAIRIADGVGAFDSVTEVNAIIYEASTTNNQYSGLGRSIFLFDSSGLDDDAIISAATLSLYGSAKSSGLDGTPDINIYSSNPTSNITLEAGDYASLGADAFCDTPITYANWKTTDPFWNDFVLNATGIASIDREGVSKFGTRNAYHDVGGVQPPWISEARDELNCYTADKGNGFKPKLVVTYTTVPDEADDFVATDTRSGEVRCTWTNTAGTTKAQLYRGGAPIGAELGAVETTDDATAGAPSITAGNAVATDGDHPDKVALSLAGTSFDNGTVYSYTVRLGNAAGWSGDSNADNGNRASENEAWQWQVDRGAGWGNIAGATASTYDDSVAPAGTVTPGIASASDGSSLDHTTLSLAGEGINDGATNEYRCALTADGCANQTSGSNTGFRRPTNLTYQWYRSGDDADAGYVLLGGATSDPYNDTTAPADGSGRWYYCEVNATGAVAVDSTHSRGYRASPPIITTEAYSGFDKLWAIVNANIVSEGTSPVTVIGFEYGLTSTYTDNWTKTGTWNTGDDFWARLAPLTPATVYHFRAMAYNGVWAYGGDRVFSTEGSPTLYEYLNTGGDGDSGAIYSANWTAEQFTSDNTSHTITSVRVPLKRVGDTPGIVTLAITYADSSDFPTGADMTSAVLNGDAMTTSYVWYDFDVPDITTDYATSYAITVKALSANSTDYILWQADSGGSLADAVGSHSSDSGITWVSDSPTDYLFEIWGESAISIEEAQVFTGYIEEGDWLVALTYKNTFEPYSPTEDIEAYFYLQLLDDTTIKAQVNCPMWGYRPGCIYIGKALADTLEWGSTDYKVRMIGSFSPYPYADYAMTVGDWTGGELSFLDRWVIAQADAIADYDDTTLTVNIADKGKVLNAEGHTIFSLGITGLNEVRPDLFEMVVLTPTHEEAEHTHALTDAADWEVKLGATLSGLLTTWGAKAAMDGKTFGGVLCFGLFVVAVAGLAAMGALPAGFVLGYMVLLGGAWCGLINWELIGVLTFFALLIFVWEKVLTR